MLERHFSTRCAGQYSVREAFEGSTVLITGATGGCNILFCPGCLQLALLTLAFPTLDKRCGSDAGYIGGLVLEQLLRVGCIGKVSETVELTRPLAV